jgi:hypothetical protein
LGADYRVVEIAMSSGDVVARREGRADLGMYVGVFAAAVVTVVLVGISARILDYVGGESARRSAWALAGVGLAVGGGVSLVLPWRGAVALCGPALLGVWFLLKASSHPTYVSALMAAAFLPLGVVLVGGVRVGNALIACVVGALGAVVGWVLGPWLMGVAGAEASWFLAAAAISTAALGDGAVGRAKWAWVVAFFAAAVGAMLAAIQIGTAPMRLEYHMHTPRILEQSDH